MPDHAQNHAHSIPTIRNCTIEISNRSSAFFLINPKVHMVSGFVYNPPQPTLRPGATRVCSFTKASGAAKGAVGVVTYELYNMGLRRGSGEVLAAMFSVPYDRNLYGNWLAVGVFRRPRARDRELFDLMYYKKDDGSFRRQEAGDPAVTFRGGSLDVRGSMSDEGKAVVRLLLSD